MPIAKHILGPRYFKGTLMVLKIDNDLKMNKTRVENTFYKLIINNKELHTRVWDNTYIHKFF